MGSTLTQTPGDCVGIYRGQFYYVIKEAKALTDYETENQLMEPLLTIILGVGKFQQTKHNDKDYYSASKEVWENALGTTIRILS